MHVEFVTKETVKNTFNSLVISLKASAILVSRYMVAINCRCAVVFCLYGYESSCISESYSKMAEREYINHIIIMSMNK